MKERDYLFDNIKAVFITATVFAHYLRQNPDYHMASVGGVIYICCFGFIMQGFIMVSGYFSQNTVKCRNGAVKNFLLPYVLMVFLVSGISMLIRGCPRGNLAEPSFALWFMLALFVYRFSIDTLKKIPFLLPLAAALYLLSGCVEWLDESYAGGRIAAFLLFFVAGFFMKPEMIQKMKGISKPWIFTILALNIACAAAIGYRHLIQDNVLFLKDPYKDMGLGPWEGILWRAFLAAFYLGWLVIIVNLTPSRKTFLTSIGQGTMTVYLLHLGVRYLLMYTPLSGTGGIDSYLIAIVLAALSVYAFSRPAVGRCYDRIIDTLYRPLDFCWKNISAIYDRFAELLH